MYKAFGGRLVALESHLHPGTQFEEGPIKNRIFVVLVLLTIICVTAAFYAITSNEWLVGNQPAPTLIPTASINLHETEAAHRVAIIPAIATATVIRPPDTPTPLATLTPLPTATATSMPSPTATASPLPTATASQTATEVPTETPIPPTATTAPPTAAPPTAPPPTDPPPTAPPPPSQTLPDLNLVPGQPQAYLSRFRLVAYYGSPMGRGLGILGNQSRSQTLRLLQGDVALFQALSPERLVIPGYHMVTTVANAYPPDYRHHVELGVIEEWVASAKLSGVAVILDIQPGRANLMDEFNRIRYLLYEPHVHLALDPEFTMNDEQEPSVNLGQLSASQINEIQGHMNGIGYEIGLNRILIVHQFVNRMLPDKALIEPYPFVELVIDGDGFGPPATKIANYNQYAGEPGFEYGGFKLFPFNGDVPLMSPDWVMSALFPQPVIIIYQ